MHLRPYPPRPRDAALLKKGPDGLDFLIRASAQIGDGAFANLLALSVRLPEQDGRLGASVGHDIDMHGYIISFIHHKSNLTEGELILVDHLFYSFDLIQNNVFLQRNTFVC